MSKSFVLEQVEGAYARKNGGTGLGLPFARKLAEIHGGSLTLESTLNKGTVAFIRLPPDRFVQCQDQDGAMAGETADSKQRLKPSAAS